MTFFESIILGLAQGLTEFLPISSSGHLILIRKLLNVPLEGSLSFDVFLNTATLFAVIYCFWGDIKAILRDFFTQSLSSRNNKLVLALIIGTIPAGFFGFFYGEAIENIFRNSSSVAWALIGGSLLMFLADMVSAGRLRYTSSSQGGITPWKGFLVGIFQSLALIPGISRSGVSISGGILAKLSREEAIKFSFLLLIPVSLGAILKILIDPSFQISNFVTLNSCLAFLSALLSGIWAVRFLVRYLSSNKFTLFIIYRLILAIIILIFL